jgi:hypothetical protein
LVPKTTIQPAARTALPRSLYGALDDLLFDERIDRAVARALERARRRWRQDLP